MAVWACVYLPRRQRGFFPLQAQPRRGRSPAAGAGTPSVLLQCAAVPAVPTVAGRGCVAGRGSRAASASGSLSTRRQGRSRAGRSQPRERAGVSRGLQGKKSWASGHVLAPFADFVPDKGIRDWGRQHLKTGRGQVKKGWSVPKVLRQG